MLRRLGLVTFLAAVGLALTASVGLAGGRGLGRVGSVPTPPSGSAPVGAVAAETPLRLTLALRPRDPAALDRFVAAVTTPGSPLYRHYLARGEFGRRFGADPATIRAVVSALRAAGFQPGPVSPNGLSIPVSASAQAVQRGLHTSLERFRLPSGRTGYANTSAPQLPTSVAGDVVAVVGLNTLARPRPQLVRPRDRAQGQAASSSSPASRAEANTSGPQACPQATTAASDQKAYTPAQLASAYGMTGLYSGGTLGQGVTVALYELEPNSLTDISTYQTCFGTSAAVSYVQVDGGSGSGPGEGEAALDIEGVIGLAPHAAIDVYQGPNNNGSGPLDTYQKIVDDDTAQIISTSWGLCEPDSSTSDLSAEHDVFAQAATQGQTIVAASGDSGSEDCNGDGGSPLTQTTLSVDDPASQPYVTAVGGTTLTAISPTRSERVWNRGVTGGAGGGGVSSVWPLPSYQSSLTPITGNPCGASSSHCREVPDVSADADPNDGYLVYYSDPKYGSGWYGFGGTSAAAPLWGALTALADSSGLGNCASHPVGFLNPSLYGIAAAGSAAYASAFYDITSGNNDMLGTHTGHYNAGSGYDAASGLGTPNGYISANSGLVPELCGTAPPAVGSVSTTSGPEAGGNAVTLTGFDFQPGSAAPTVSFGGSPATVNSASNTQLQVTVPSGSGTVPVTVSNPNGTSNPVNYTYVAPSPPPSGGGPSGGASTSGGGSTAGTGSTGSSQPTSTTPTQPTGGTSTTPTPAPAPPPVRRVALSLGATGALRYHLTRRPPASAVHIRRDSHHRPVRVTATFSVRGARGGTARVTVSLVHRRRGWAGSVLISDPRAHFRHRFSLAGAPRIYKSGTVTGTARLRTRRRLATLRFRL